MKIKNYLFFLFLLFLISYNNINSQPQIELVKVIVTPDHPDWTYEIGAKAEFEISFMRNNILMNDLAVRYKIQPDPGYRNLEVWDEGKLVIQNQKVSVTAPEFEEPGFLRCTAIVEVDGKEYFSYATVGFAPEKIQPTTSLPDDFEVFWNKAKEDLANIPVSPKMTLMPERCTDKVDVYHVSMDNIEGKIYGVLCTPKGTGKYPAILHVPGAGIRPYYGNIAEAEKGFISLSIGIHGIPVNLDKGVYKDLAQGALKNYWVINLDDKDKAYYKRVYLGCIRAVDFLVSLDNYDSENLGVTGGSQGGALSIITASLDNRISYLAAFYPALSDLTGFLYGRAGGWPQIFTDEYTNKTEKIENSKYFDVVNFARFLKVPGWYSWGYNDNVCPPVSLFSAYNVIEAEKELHVFHETRHWTFPEQRELKDKWLFAKLKK